MTLIPLISAIVAAPEATMATTAPAGRIATSRHDGYGSGAGYRAVAAGLAVGLPAALIAAVALSPMIIDREPVSAPVPWKSFTLPPPPPAMPDPEPQQRPQPQQAVVTATPTPLPPVASTPPLAAPIPIPFPAVDTGPGPVLADPPAPPAEPALVVAQLDKRFLGAFQPDYPARAQREGLEGVVRVRILIGIDGRVKAVELVRSDDPAFFEATKRRALAKWRFKPATRGGVAEESWTEMTVRFQIRNG